MKKGVGHGYGPQPWNSASQAIRKLGEYRWTAEDFKGWEWVAVRQRRGFQLFESAFAIQWGGWYFVFTEHDGYYFFHPEDAEVMQFTQLMGALPERKPVLGEEIAQLVAGHAKFMEKRKKRLDAKKAREAPGKATVRERTRWNSETTDSAAGLRKLRKLGVSRSVSGRAKGKTRDR